MSPPHYFSSEVNMRTKIVKDFKKNRFKYFIVLLPVVYFVLFHYKPMYGIVIAFQRFNLTKGIAESPWCGLLHFKRFFKDYYFGRLLRNTLSISVLYLLFSFPAPIVLALMLNEVRVSWFKRAVQTVSYLPHFISSVIICGLITTFTGSTGLINTIIDFFGGERSSLLSRSEMFYPIYIVSGIWQSIGWDSIIYLATLAGIDQEQYDAAKVDGANRFQQICHITFPGIIPTMSMLLILRIGSLISVGSEKILLLYSEKIYDVADVISTYVYRKGIIDADYSYSTAVGLFNSVVSIILVLTANKVSKKVGQSGLF